MSLELEAPVSPNVGGQFSESGEQKLTGTPKKNQLSSAFLVEAGEIETRLRKHVLELIEPTIRKQTLLDSRFREAKTALDTHAIQLRDLSKLQQGASSAQDQIDKFRVELAEGEKERRIHEQAVGERLSLQETEINALRQTIEKKASSENHIGRTLKTMGDLLTSTREEISELRRFLCERLDVNRDKIAKLRDEFETRVMAVENEMHRLMDNQITDDTIISHMKGELSRMSDSVAEAIKGLGDLDCTKASVTCVEEQQQEFSEFARQVSAHVSGLRQQFGTLIEDVKAHFETATKVVATSSSQQIESMRENYRSEVERMDNALKEVEAFMLTQRGIQTAVRNDMEAFTTKSTEEIGSLRETFEEADSKRRKQCNNLEITTQQLQRGIRDVESYMKNADRSRSVRSDLVMMLVESQLLNAALEWQDVQDRKSIALFGCKPGERPNDADKMASSNLPQIHSARNRRASRGGAAGPASGGGPAESVLSLDKRCLSCSGNTSTVLAGFKLACLQYAPSPVEYKKASYSREELIRMQMDLLDQAKEQLQSVE